LNKNLGIPILIVCNKIDSMTVLEKDFGFGDAHFEYIQQQLRRISLSYGASLIYASSKKKS